MLKTIIKPIVRLWEKVFTRIGKINVVENSPYGLLRISIHPFEGASKTLSDGTRINTGDYIGELHISNLKLAEGRIAGVQVASDLQLLPLFRKEIQNLAKLAEKNGFNPQIKAFWGVTLMAPALRRFGFELEPMQPGFRSRFLIGWMNFLKWTFSPPSPTVSTKHKSNPKRKKRPKGYQYWMSIDQLITKHGGQARHK